jgi:hypothetical protein
MKPAQSGTEGRPPPGRRQQAQVEAGHTAYHFVVEEPVQDGVIPAVGAYEQVAVALQVGAEASDDLLQPQFFRHGIRNRGEA